MAVVIKTTGERITVKPKNGIDFKLDELREIVGGYVEVVRLRTGGTMIVNEDGHNIGLPYNTEASVLYPYSPIVGDVLLCDNNQIR